MKTPDRHDPTAHLVSLTLSTAGDDIDPASLSAGRRILIDTIACAIGAASTAPARAVLEYSRLVHTGGGTATVLDGDFSRTLDPTQAAFVNGHLANVLDADETLLNRSHFASAVVPAALAVGQAQNCSGKALVEAVVIGYEVAARIGLGMAHFAQDQDGNVRHVLAGNSAAAFGATAAAGRLVGLDARQMEHAFGIVGKSAPVHFTWGSSGAFAGYFDATTVPGLHKYGMYGVLARTGVEAAYLARAGYTAAPKQFAPEAEFWKSFGADEFEYESLYHPPTLGWWVRHSALKPWPTCRFGHVAMSLLSDVLVDRDLSIDELTGLEVTIPSFPFLQLMGDTRDPDTPEKLVFSLPVALASLASRTPPGARWWEPEVFYGERVRALAAMTTVTSDSALVEPMHAELKEHRGYYSIPTQLTVRARGEEFTASGSYAYGDPSLLGIANDKVLDLGRKFADFTDDVLGAEGAASMYRRLSSIEDVSGVRQLFGAKTDRDAP